MRLVSLIISSENEGTVRAQIECDEDEAEPGSAVIPRFARNLLLTALHQAQLGRFLVASLLEMTYHAYFQISIVTFADR